MKENLLTSGVAEFSVGCQFTLDELNIALEQLQVDLSISSEEANRRIREGLASYWLKYIYEFYVVRKGCENASKEHYVNTYIKSGLSIATYKSYESHSRVNEAINKGNLRLIISAFCRFSNEFQQRKHSPLDCLLLIMDGRTRHSKQFNSDFVARQPRGFLPKQMVIVVTLLVLGFLGAFFLMNEWNASRSVALQFDATAENALQPQRQLFDELRDIGAVEYMNHATDQVKPEKLQIKYPTKHSVYIYPLTDDPVTKSFGGHASYKNEIVRINWVLIKCQTDCMVEFTQRGGPQQRFGSTQTHKTVEPPINNWHVSEMPLFAGRNIFIVSAIYSNGIKRVESLVIEPQIDANSQ